MLLVTDTHPLSSRFGDEKAIEMFAKAGFDALDYSAFHARSDDSPIMKSGYKEYAAHLKKVAESNGISFVQAHAPFQYMSDDADYFNSFNTRIIRAMEAAAIMGAEVIVVHPIQNLVYKDNRYKLYDANMKFYALLIEYAKEFGIKIACENMFQSGAKGIGDSVCASPEEFNKYVDDIASPWVTACLDLGHCGVCGRKAQDMLRAMGGERITALHIHDNDGITDLHKLPGTVSMNWDEICKALADIGYKGNFTYEVSYFLSDYDDEFLPIALKFMHDTGRYYISKIKLYEKEKSK